jgi:hypothetical protein
MIWLPDGDEVPDRQKRMIQNLKLMRTFVWTRHVFQVADAMPKGKIFATACYVRHILTETVVRR